jgi:hypothetical protein
MFFKSVLLFVCAFLIFADNYEAKLQKREREPQIVSASKPHQKKKYDISDKYQPNWESLDSRPLPQWYDDAKFGES